MNMNKTKIMSNSRVVPTLIKVGNSKLEVVDQYTYIYLGQIIHLGKSNFQKEVNRGIQLGWAAYGRLRSMFSAHIPQCLKTKVFNSCVLPVMTNGTDVAAYNGSYKEAQRRAKGNGKGYARGIFT
jgi:hypothetical protein